MKGKLFVPILVAAIVAIPQISEAYRLEEEWHRSFDVRDKAEFVLKNTNGSVTVEGWNRSEIDVTAEIRIKAPSKTKARRLLSKIDFDVDAGPRRVRIEADLPRVRLDGFFGLFGGESSSITIRYRVRVPERIDLEIRSTNGGIRVHEVRGPFDLHTTNGGIDLYSLGGEGSITTVNGSVECVIADLSGKGDIEIKAVNGGVELRIPEHEGGRLDAKSLNGGVDLDLPLEDEIKIKRSSVVGNLGGGGRIRIRTVNGRISLDSI